MTDIEIFFRLHKIVKQKNWDKDYITNSFFEDAIYILNKLSEQEQQLYFDLLERYSLYPYITYESCIIEGMKNFNTPCDELYIIPSLAKKDLNNPRKSGFFVERIFSTPHLQKNLNIKKIIIGHKPPKNRNNLFMRLFHFQKVDQNKAIKRHYLFIDDFNGSGKTGYGCIKRYKKKYKMSWGDISYFSIISMEKGLKKIASLGVNSFSYKTFNRGISDRKIPKKEIEKLLFINKQICDKYHIEDPRGFDKSESLVSMMNTPNNTFPIFWDSKMGKPLFPRFKT